MKIGVIGMGAVGTSLAEVLKEAHEIIPYDKFKEPYTNPERLAESEIVFICVPTPMKRSGEIDCSIIHSSLRILEGVTFFNSKKPLVVIRSISVSGVTDELEKKYPFNFVFNPEFVRDKHASSDQKKIQRIVIGANREEDYLKVESAFKTIFPQIKYIWVNRKTAEMIKYAANCMLAGQIALANEFYHICEVAGVDYNTVKDAILFDDRIGTNISVPGPDGDFGFGGSSLPKDINSLILLARKHRYRPYVLEEIWRLNEKIRKNKDWEEKA